MLKQLQKDALIAGFVSIFIVLAVDILVLITVLSLLSDYFSSDSLYLAIKIFSITSLAFPPYVAARALIRGTIDLSDFNPAAYADPATRRLAENITIVIRDGVMGALARRAKKEKEGDSR